VQTTESCSSLVSLLELFDSAGRFSLLGNRLELLAIEPGVAIFVYRHLTPLFSSAIVFAFLSFSVTSDQLYRHRPQMNSIAFQEACTMWLPF